jgi:hypothetical protein
MVKSRFSFTVYALFLLVAGFIAVGVFLLANPAFGSRNGVENIKPAVLPGFAVFFIGVILCYFYARRLFFLMIDPDQLILFTRFTRFTIPKTEISRIYLMGRGSVLNNSADVLKIITASGQSFSLPDQYCSNMTDIKATLLDAYRELIVDAPMPREVTDFAASAGDEEFRGNHLLSINGILFYGITIVFVGMEIKIFHQNQGSAMFIPAISILVFGALLGAQLFYFRITGDTLEIRNHLIWWYKRAYPLSDIAQVVFEQIQKRSNTLRIRTIDFRSSAFSAGSLRDRHWAALAAALKKRGIPVQNELALQGLPLTRDE